MELVEFIDFLSTRLGQQCLIEEIPNFSSDCYTCQLFVKYPHFQGEYDHKLLYEAFLGFSATKAPNERCEILTIICAINNVL